MRIVCSACQSVPSGAGDNTSLIRNIAHLSNPSYPVLSEEEYFRIVGARDALALGQCRDDLISDPNPGRQYLIF